MKTQNTAATLSLIEQIASQHLGIDSLQTQHSDHLDFHEVSVWSLASALQASFDAGKTLNK